ncbi:kinase-like domain-containing protein [Thelephora terrestris]|uniref:Kinase-like domain-containing protein n=1 Tax=Thelephora terrestris TaxID=56493 RepID=A0A9P6LE07_9AGAM|nr:kinase-like domain-containing protein [Thelephora terrestris]
MVETATKRKLTGFRRVRDASELHPITTRSRTGRRMDGNGIYITPLRQLTTHLVDTYHICNPQFRYESTHNPRRVLTKPSKPAHNDGYDNEDYDYILYVNDWLGTDDGHNAFSARYLILDILGQGTFGQVVKCQNMKTHEIVAVKVVKNKPAYFNQSMMEVTILELLNNQCDPNDEHHILRLRDSFIHRSHLCLVFELLSSNLYELIKQNQFQGLSTQLVKVFTAQLLDALTVLKDARLIHCDLKPENILLRSLQSPQIKVIDFGSACHERQTVYTYIQSRFYRSPEVLLGIPYNAAIDMWSLGCIAVELFLGLPLFPGTSEYNQITRIVEMLGMPPIYMMDLGKQTGHFFDSYTDAFGHKKYRLKSIEQYSRERNTNEQPGKQYFKATTLPDIINQAPMPNFKSSRHGSEVEKELNNRASFIDFCQGLLNLNPVERWTPQQARQHPFITGEKFTKSWSPHTQPVPQPSPQHSISPVDPKRPYGGLVPSQPKGTRAFQDAASYNQHLAQQQAYTAQATAQANTFVSRNPYIAQPTGNGPTFPNNQDKTGAGYSHPINSNTSTQQQYLGPNTFPVPHNNQPPVPPTSYYPNTNARTRAGNAGQMDNIPPALARLQHMNQDVIGGRNALTPVLKRDDAIREWERRQTGKVAAAQPYPQLEYLHQQAELVASQGLANWHPGPSGGNRYTGVGGSGQPPPTSGLAHSYHLPQTNQPLVVDEDRRDVVMSSVRNAARSDGPNATFGVSSDAVTSPSQVYTSGTTAGNRYPNYSQPSQQSQTSSDISNLYVPMQPDQFVGYQGSSAQNQAANRVGGGGLGGGGPSLPAAFYSGGANASGQMQGGIKDARKQSNPEIWPR